MRLEQLEALRVHKSREHAIRYLGGIADARRCDRGRIYLHLWIAVQDALQRLAKSGRARTGERDLVVLACVSQRLIALEDLVDDFNVLAGAQEWLSVSNTVAALPPPWGRRTDSKDQP